MSASQTLNEFVGEDPAIEEVREELRRSLSVPYPVLLLGETGTGKELAAKLLHRHGPRRDGPLLAFNCAALPDSLLESQLFGHRRGAFTNAHRDAPGLFESARGGTLLLDELQELSLPAQAKLLRVLDSGEYLPVGATLPLLADVRIVAATNADLEARLERGLFRKDLYYRLRVLTVRLPPLREMPGQVAYLVRHYLPIICAKVGMAVPVIAPGAMAALVAARWPGNVRQLIHELERATLRVTTGEVRVENLSPELQGLAPGPRISSSFSVARERVALAWERDQLRRGLEETGWNVTRLAHQLGLSRRGLTLMLARHALHRPLHERSLPRRGGHLSVVGGAGAG